MRRTGTEIGFGTSGRYPVERHGSGAYAGPYGSFGFPDAVFPAFNQWHHLAYVCSGGPAATFTIYCDGVPIIETIAKGLPPGGADAARMFLGCTWAGARPTSFFTGSDALEWTMRTRECIVSNHAWSVELWACPQDPHASNQVMVAWGTPDNGVRCMWGGLAVGRNHATRWRRPPSTGSWHHIVYTCRGGGLSNGPCAITLFVDGVQDHTTSSFLNIPADQAISIGGVPDGKAVVSGFSGALAHVRIYDYDLSVPQIEKQYREERTYYRRENTGDGTLFVDLDARTLAARSS